MPTPSSPAPAGKALPGARLALVLLLLINLFNYIDRNVLAAVVPGIMRTFFGEEGAAGAAHSSLGPLLHWCELHLGFKPEKALVGLLSTAFMVTYMFGAPIFGRLAEKRPRWALIGIGVILWSVASSASGLAAGFVALLLTRCLVGVGEAAYAPVAPSILSDLYPVERRGSVLAWFYMAIPVGSALGYVLGEQVSKSGLGDWSAAHLGGSADSWRWAFYLVMPPGLILGWWAICMRETPRGQADGPQPAPGRVAWSDYLVLLRTPSYVLCTLGMTAMTFAMGGIAFWMPVYLEERLGPTGNATSIFGVITFVAGLTGTLAGGWAGDRLRGRFPGSYFLVSGAAMLAGFPMFLWVLHAPFPLGWGLMFLACFCLFFNTGPSNTILANVTHPSIRAAGFALTILVSHALGDVISPVIIGVVSDRYGMTTGFLVVGVMFVVAGLLWLLGARHLARDTAEAPRRPVGPARIQPATA